MNRCCITMQGRFFVDMGGDGENDAVAGWMAWTGEGVMFWGIHSSR
jgi:hypothetical protein